jgi:tetratricopeptide (TPR) repeat protein
MVRRRKSRAQFARYGARGPLVVCWLLGLAAAVAAVLGLAYLVGGGRAHTGWIPDEMLATLVRAGPALALAFAGLVVAAWCFRHLWLEWLAWRPGRIDVGTLVAGPSVTDADLPQLTMSLRQRLAVLRLQAPAPVPGTAPEGDFLEVLSRGTVDARNVLGTLLSVVRAAVPSHAWQVSGVLVTRRKAPCFGVTMQVIRLPDRGNPPQTLWASSWDDAVRRAADGATATILTRTRLCRSPWASWRRFVLPGELLEAYEQAVRLEEDRCYDEALDAYSRALDHDPMNMVIRLHIGQLQEKLALYLDALATYQGMLDSNKRDVHPRRLEWWRYRFAARAERHRALLIARYRRVVLLGGGALAQQWRTTADGSRWTARDRRRRDLRERLRWQLVDDLTAAGRKHGLERLGRLSPKVLLAEPHGGTSGDRDDDRARLELRELLALAALDGVKSLGRTTRISRSDLTARSVRLTGVCIAVRLQWIRSQLRTEQADRPLTPAEVERRRWPVTPGDVERSIKRVTWLAPPRRWHEHYNAACAYALPLRVDVDDRAGFACKAIHHLEQSTTHASSAFIVSRRDWLLSEDPDLDGLRAAPAFKNFEAVFFPGEVATPPRPRHVHRLETARYIRDMLVGTASCWEDVWHERGRTLSPQTSIHTMLAWWSDECRAWALVRSVAVDFRHWRARLDLLTAMRGWSEQYGFDPLDVCFRRYEEDPLPEAMPAMNPAPTNGRTAGRNGSLHLGYLWDSAAAVWRRCTPGGRTATGEPPCATSEGPAGQATDRAACRLVCLAGILEDEEPKQAAQAMLAQIERWQVTLRELDAGAREPKRLAVAQLCHHHAALWQRLAEWLATGMFDDDTGRILAFEDQLAVVSRLWCRSYARWRQRETVAALRSGVASTVR